MSAASNEIPNWPAYVSLQVYLIHVHTVMFHSMKKISRHTRGFVASNEQLRSLDSLHDKKINSEKSMEWTWSADTFLSWYIYIYIEWTPILCLWCRSMDCIYASNIICGIKAWQALYRWWQFSRMHQLYTSPSHRTRNPPSQNKLSTMLLFIMSISTLPWLHIRVAAMHLGRSYLDLFVPTMAG